MMTRIPAQEPRGKLQAKTLLLAVSAFLAVPALSQLSPKEVPYTNHYCQLRQQSNLALPSFRRLLPSIASILVRGQHSGMAVLIDSSGLYLSTKIVGVTGEVELSFHDGHIGHATVLSEDGCTQMVLLRSDYVPAGSNAVIAASDTPPGTSLVVVLSRGAVTARVVSDSRIGVVKPFNRVVPLSEVRLELPEASLGGAPVFTSEGAFVGLLSASLIHTETANVSLGPPRGRGSFGGGRALDAYPRNVMGPADLTVAYLPSPDVVRLVLEGFNSPSHIVDHPSLGVFCRNGAGGALIQEVVNDSAASHIGLKEGDLILEMGEYPVRDKSDFAKVMFKIRAGNRIAIRFDRDGKTMTREATLGRSSD